MKYTFKKGQLIWAWDCPAIVKGNTPDTLTVEMDHGVHAPFGQRYRIHEFSQSIASQIETRAEWMRQELLRQYEIDKRKLDETLAYHLDTINRESK